jgi:hypothetical protein
MTNFYINPNEDVNKQNNNAYFNQFTSIRPTGLIPDNRPNKKYHEDILVDKGLIKNSSPAPLNYLSSFFDLAQQAIENKGEYGYYPIFSLVSGQSYKRNIFLSNNTIDEGQQANSTVGTFSVKGIDKDQKFSLVEDYPNQYDNKYFRITENNILKTNEVFYHSLDSSFRIKVKYEGRKFSVVKEFTIVVNKVFSGLVESGSDIEVSFDDSEFNLKFENVSNPGIIFMSKISSYPGFTMYSIQPTCSVNGDIEIVVNKPSLSSSSVIMQIEYNEDTGDIVFKHIPSETNNGQIKAIIDSSSIQSVIPDSLSENISTLDVNDPVLVHPTWVVTDVCQNNVISYSTCVSGGNSTLNCGGSLTPQYDNAECPPGQRRVATGIDWGQSTIFVGSECGCWEDSAIDVMTVVDLAALLLTGIAGPRAAVCALSSWIKPYLIDKIRTLTAREIRYGLIRASVLAIRTSIDDLGRAIQNLNIAKSSLLTRIENLNVAIELFQNQVTSITNNITALGDEFYRRFNFRIGPDYGGIRPDPDPVINNYITRMDNMLERKGEFQAMVDERIASRNQQASQLTTVETSIQQKATERAAKQWEMTTKEIEESSIRIEISNMIQEWNNAKSSWDTATSALYAAGAAAASAANLLLALNTISYKKTCNLPLVLDESPTGNCECKCPDPCEVEPDCGPRCTDPCSPCVEGVCEPIECPPGQSCCGGECCGGVCCDDVCCGSGEICCDGSCCDGECEENTCCATGLGVNHLYKDSIIP